jgi:hypothetical protein
MRKSAVSNTMSVLLVIFYLLLPFLHFFQNLDIKNSNKNLVQADNFQMQTGGYLGNGNSISIEGLGFAPDLVMLKARTNAGIGAIFRTSAMVNNVDAGFIAIANSSGAIILDPDGFTAVGANANSVNVYYTWIAFGGSDCSATGNFCVGAYTGNSSGTRAFDIGFQPDAVWVKANGNNPATWRTSVMPANSANFFSGTITDATGIYFTTLDATGFTVGASNNGALIYYYVAFKNTANAVSVGSYTGNGTSQNINVGFHPDFVFLKNSATTGAAMYNVTESLGLNSYVFSDSAVVTTGITNLITTPVSGFSLGNSAVANGNTNTHYYVAFAGASDTRTSSGTFTMAQGTYTGTGATGTYINIDNLDFKPDLVIVKADSTQVAAFRTSLMQGDKTATMSLGTAHFTGGIVAIESHGFTIGSSTILNTSGATYYWQAFGGAWTPRTNSGSAEFSIGTYFSSTVDDANIPKLPFQPDLITIKGDTAQEGVFRTSSHTGDLSSHFSATAEAANIIQSISANSFQVGTNTKVNASGIINDYFTFKTGSNFAVGSYNGNGAARDITVGFQPDYIWIKDPTASNTGISRSSDQAGDGGLPFPALANVTNTITAIISTGFSLGTSGYVNTNAVNDYRWVAWRGPVTTVVSITISDGTVTFGTMNFSTSKDTITLTDTQQVTNNGNVAIDIAIKGYDTGCPWTLAGTIGAEQYTYEYSLNAGGSWTPLTTTYSSMITSLGVAASDDFDLKLSTPTTTACATEQTVDLTLIATEN